MRAYLFKTLLALLFFYTVCGFWLVPMLLQSQLPPFVEKATQGRLQIGNIDFNPFFMEMHMEGVEFRTPADTPLFTLQEGYVNLDLSALLIGDLRFYAIRLKQPELYVAKRAEGFNFEWLLHLPAEPKPAAPETAPLPPVKILLFALENGAVHFSDQEREFSLAIDPIGFTAHHIDFRQIDASGQYARLHAELSDGGSIDIKSHLRSLAPFIAEGTIDLQGLKPYTAWRYGKDLRDLEVADGSITVHAEYRYDSASPETSYLENLTARLEKLRIKSKSRHHDLFRIERLMVASSRVEPFSSRVELGRITFEGLYLSASRDSEGRIDWIEYLQPSRPAETETPKDDKRSPTPSPWRVTAQGIDLNSSILHFDDNAPALKTATHIDKITLHTGAVDSAAQTSSPFALKMRINGEGYLEANGTVTHTPLALRMQTDLKTFSLDALTPYLQERTYLKLKEGLLSLQSHLDYTVSSATPLQLHADIGLDGLLLTDSRSDEQLLGWERLAIEDIAFSLPPRLHVNSIELKNAHINPRIEADGSLNFSSLQKEITPTFAGAGSSEDNATGPEMAFTVDTFNISGAAVEFADDSLPLPYNSRLHEINGRITHIAVPAGVPSHFDMTMTVDDYAPVRINGSILGSDPRADTHMTLSLENFALQSITPYSARFVGRAIDGGKLLLHLDYRLDAAQLQGENIATIERIRLGDSVKHPDALQLPLGLAIALLEDKDGRIEIDLPVRGDANAPDFRFGKLLAHAFGDLIVKVTTAPFRFLGAMLGSDEERLDTIAFDAGSSVLLPKEREKLDLLARALQQRPRLMLQFDGCYESESDTRMLRMQQLYLQADALAGADALNEEGEIRVETLERLFAERHGEAKLAVLKTDNEKDVTKAYRNALIEQTLLNITLQAGSLEALAAQRRAQIRERLMTTGGVAPERLKEKSEEIAKKTRNCVMELAF